jgi:hypothetical protein
MKQSIIFFGLAGILSILICFITLSLGIVWQAPNEGLLHNLFRYGFTSSVIFGGIWVVLFVYREIKE